MMGGILITIGAAIILILYSTVKHAVVLSNYAPPRLTKEEKEKYIHESPVGRAVTGLLGFQWLEIILMATVFGFLFGLGAL